MSFDQAPFALRLFRYKTRKLAIGGKGLGSWKETWLALSNDDTLIWYNDKHCSRIHGRIDKFSTTALPFLKAGLVAAAADEIEHIRPRRPNFSSQDEALYLSLPKLNGKKLSDRHWFYVKNEFDLLTCLRHFASAINGEGEFRTLVDRYQIGDRPLGRRDKYKRFGLSLKGDSKSTFALGEDIGSIWREFVNSRSSIKNEKINNGYVETERNISVIEFGRSEIDNALTTADDVGYCSSKATASDSGHQSCRDERSDSERSAADTSCNTTISVEVHSNNAH